MHLFVQLTLILQCDFVDVELRKTEMDTHLGVREVMKGALVGSVRLWELIHHQIAVTKRTPDFPAGVVDCQDPLKDLGCLILKKNVWK
jgi:hypothetical protein